MKKFPREKKHHKVDDEHRGKYQYVARSLFSHAIVNYASCFLKGGKSKEKPLDALLTHIHPSDTHTEIMRNRRKLIGHLDENDDLREDVVLWTFQNQDSMLRPAGPDLKSFKTLLLRDPDEKKWIKHIEYIIQLADQKVNEISENVNLILNEVTVIE